MDDERRLLINTFVNCKNKLEAGWNNQVQRIPKDQDRSKSVRQEGNALYKKDKHDAQTHLEILSHYSRSIALAPNNSEELALGYGNRSAFLLHIGKYKECIQDIDRAGEITSSKVLKAKLLCRKVRCLKILGSSEYKSIIEEAKSWIKKIIENGENKKQLLHMINEVIDFSSNNQESTIIEDTKKTKLLEILSQKESEDVLQSVDIKYDETFGRHLVAVKDFRPGDIIFAEKLYGNVTNPMKHYTNCNYCLQICWSGIPCDHCSWVMFCSQTCKNEAWQKYHDLECSVIPYAFLLIQNDFQKYSLNTFRISVRMLIIGIKEAGSVSKLKAQLKSIDECSEYKYNELKKISVLETTYRGFVKNGKIMSNMFNCVYTLKSTEITNSVLQEVMALNAIFVLISFIKNSLLIEKKFQNKGISDMMKDEEVLFLGSLLIKLVKIKMNNAHSIGSLVHKCENSNNKCIQNNCCERGNCIASLASLINHSCFPNVNRCFTEDNKIIIFAVQPIKKNSQIFDTYLPVFHLDPITERKKLIEQYHFVCNCPACSENWPPLLNLPKNLKDEQDATPKSSLEIKLFNDCVQVFRCLDNGQTQFDLKAVKTLSKAITKGKKCLKQPSLLYCLMFEALRKVFSHIYGVEQQSVEQCINK